VALKYLISVVGPTAIGKTSLAITLAKHYKTEIVSADSRQFFKEMQIGTAVPSKEEIATVPHHFIQHKSIFESYSVGDFEKEAIALLSNLFKKNDCVIMIGGSGLYVDAVTIGLDEFPDVDPGIREDLNKKLKEKGIFELQNQLKLLDETQYAKIDIDNPHRLIRALEICIGSGQPYSSFLNKKKIKRPFKTITVGLKADRQVIYDRINQRVDIMIKEGLLKEAQKMYPHRTLNALQTVGYKELFNYFDGEWDLDFAISEIKKNTRRFAKRQLTWYRKNEKLIWFGYDEDKVNIIKTIDEEISALQDG
jgi:tRNA dimethylallyltransferase